MAVTGISGLTADKNLRSVTDPDPTEIVQDLKMLPDNTLIQYAKDRSNPNATYALTVLMSRKRAKEALAKEDMPESTVAEDVIADVAQPPASATGIGGASMFIPENRKKDYLAQQLMAQAGPQGAQPMNMEGINTQPMTRQQASNMIGVNQLPSNVGNYNLSGGGIVSFAGNEGSYVGTGWNPRMSNDYIVTDPRKRPGLQNVAFTKELTPKEEALKLLEEENKKDLTLHSNPTEEQKALIEEMKKKYPTPSEEKIIEDVAPEEDILKTTDQLKDNILDLEKDRQLRADDLINKQGVNFDQLKDTRTMDDYSEEVRKSRIAAGVTDDYLRPIEQDIKSQKQLYERDTRRAADLALIEAGLLIAGGTSPYALANLKEAAPAVRNYGVMLKDLRGDKREIAKMEMQVEAAKQAIKVGEADKAFSLFSDAQKINKDLDKTKLTEENKVKVAELNNQAAMLKQQLANEGRYRSSDEVIFTKLANDPRYQDKDGRPDYDKIIKTMSGLKSTSMSGTSTLYKAASEQYTRLQNMDPDKYPESGREGYIRSQIEILQGTDDSNELSVSDQELINKYSGRR